jgi:hypothetical protein
MLPTQIFTELFNYLIENAFIIIHAFIIILTTIFLIDYFVNKKIIFEKLKMGDEQSKELFRLFSELEDKVTSNNEELVEAINKSFEVMTNLEERLVYRLDDFGKIVDHQIDTIISLQNDEALSSLEEKKLLSEEIGKVEDRLNRNITFIDDYFDDIIDKIDNLEQKVEQKVEQKIIELNQKLKGLINEQTTIICEFYVCISSMNSNRGSSSRPFENLLKILKICFPSLDFDKYGNENYERIKESLFPTG